MHQIIGGGHLMIRSLLWTLLWNCNCWFRDPSAGGAGFNTSDALLVTLVP